MMLLITLLVLIIILLVFLLCLYMRETAHLLEQLHHVEEGSHIELTSNTRNALFLKLYRELNYILSGVQKKELHFLLSQNQLKHTISSLAHDIRTPLTSAAGYMQMLEDCTTSEKQLRYEHIVKGRIFELKDMLEELFLYTKLTSDEFTPECQNTAVFPVLSDCMLSLYHVFNEKQIEPDIQFENEEIAVYANPEILGRIFRNLINNALLHGEGNLSIHQQQTCITFSNTVKDDITIDLDRLFERFYKADTTRQKGSSGLGLSIVRELANQIGADIEASLENPNLLVLKITFQTSA